MGNGIVFTEAEKRILLEALQVLDREETKRCNFFEWGTVEKSNSIRKQEAIKQIKDKLA